MMRLQWWAVALQLAGLPAASQSADRWAQIGDEVDVKVLADSQIILGACAGRTSRQPPAERFIRWARTHAVPLRTVEAGGDTSDLGPLVAMVGGAHVVAIGEPAHGAHEPLALRNRVFRFLVEKMGFTAIAIESGLSESKRVHDFVLGGSGAISQVVREGLTWGFGNFAENVELVQWMRNYNADPAHVRKLGFYGIDLSGGIAGEFGRARIAVDDALLYLTRVDSASARRSRVALEPYLDRFSSARYATLSRAERDGMSAALADLVTELERNRKAFVAATSAEEYQWAYRNSLVARQLDAYLKVDGPSPPAANGAINVRDAAMAENLRWVLEREGPAGRVMVFAHNGHVMNDVAERPNPKAFAHPANAMGQHLRWALGDDLFIIGMSSAHNGTGLPSAVLDPNGVDAALERVGEARFLVDLRAAGADRAVRTWLSEPHSLRENFDTNQVLSPGTAFDALVFVDTLTRHWAAK